MISEDVGQAIRTVVRKHCASCGSSAEFCDLRRGDTVDHQCGWRGVGSTWWIRRAAGR